MQHHRHCDDCGESYPPPAYVGDREVDSTPDCADCGAPLCWCEHKCEACILCGWRTYSPMYQRGCQLCDVCTQEMEGKAMTMEDLTTDHKKIKVEVFWPEANEREVMTLEEYGLMPKEQAWDSNITRLWRVGDDAA